MDEHPIRTVFFDFGGTLVSLSPPREELFTQAARSAGLVLSAQCVRRAYQIVDFHVKFSSVEITTPAAREAFYYRYHQRLCEALGIASWFERLQPRLVAEFTARRTWQLVDGVAGILGRLQAAGIRLAIVANWDRGLSRLAEQLGIRETFACVLSSQEAGAEKPDPALFRRALDALTVSTEGQRIVYVGDDYRVDVLGARAAGLLPVLIDRDDQYPHADCLRFRSLAEWFAALRLGREGEQR